MAQELVLEFKHREQVEVERMFENVEVSWLQKRLNVLKSVIVPIEYLVGKLNLLNFPNRLS